MTELALAIAGAKSDTKLSSGESSGQAIPIIIYFFAIIFFNFFFLRYFGFFPKSEFFGQKTTFSMIFKLS